ncbi:hypothetical protein T439DRAFT_327226 [Meredithblackwellia eburnea MCA 4105]
MIYSEADAKEAFLLKYLSSIPQILNSLLSPDLKDTHYVEIFSEVPLTVKAKGGQKSTISLDLALMLVEKNGPTKFRKQKLARMHPLVIFEMKRPNIVRLDDWDTLKMSKVSSLLPQSPSSPRKLIPQLLLYAHAWSCHRFYLADSNNVLALDIDYRQVKEENKTIPIGFKKCELSDSPDSVYELGVRASIAFDGFAALHELGALNPSFLSPNSQPAFNNNRLRKYQEAPKNNDDETEDSGGDSH